MIVNSPSLTWMTHCLFQLQLPILPDRLIRALHRIQDLEDLLVHLDRHGFVGVVRGNIE